MSNSTTRDWQNWGAIDPMYAVASMPDRHRLGANPWTEDEFYASGAAEWEQIRPQWSSYAGQLHGASLEVGCGAGRMSRQLAGTFDKLIALDVSSDQLALARAAVADAPASGDFRLSTGRRAWRAWRRCARRRSGSGTALGRRCCRCASRSSIPLGCSSGSRAVA